MGGWDEWDEWVGKQPNEGWLSGWVGGWVDVPDVEYVRLGVGGQVGEETPIGRESALGLDGVPKENGEGDEGGGGWVDERGEVFPS